MQNNLEDPTNPASLWAYAFFTHKKRKKKQLNSGETKEIP
jgi:hypothetical protein